MRICVYSEWLRTPSSGVPGRGMLRELVRLRPSDEFVFLVRRGSADAPSLQQFFASCPGDNWSVAVDRRHRWTVLLKGLVGRTEYCSIDQQADVYLNTDLDYLGRRARPLIVTVADLSVLRGTEYCSVPWHGERVRRHSLRIMARQRPHITAISDATRRDLEAYAPELTGHITVIPNGIDPEWHCQTGWVSRGNGELDFAGRGYWIWWGLITRRKNVARLLRAYRALLDRGSEGPSAPGLVLVGDLGHDCADIPGLIQELRLMDDVRRISPLPVRELVDMVRASRGVVFPSLHEGFGMPVVEALARGKPVLTSDCTSLPEVSGGFARLCDPQSTDSIAAGLGQLITATPSESCEGERRRAWARQFTHAAAARAYSDLIDRVAGEPA